MEKYTVSVGSAGYGSLCIRDNGTVRGVIRYLGKPMSFSTKLVDSAFEISAKSRAGVLDAQFVVSGENVGATATFAGETVSINVSPYDGDAPAFSGKLVPVSVSIRAEAGNSLLTGSLTAAGKFIPSERFKSPLSLKFNKKTGLVGGKLGSTPFVGIVANDIISAICDNGTRISVRPTLPISTPITTLPAGVNTQLPTGAQLVEMLARGSGHSTANVGGTGALMLSVNSGTLTTIPAELVLNQTIGDVSGVSYASYVARLSSVSLSNNWFERLSEPPAEIIANLIETWTSSPTDAASTWLESIRANRSEVDRLQYSGVTSIQGALIYAGGGSRELRSGDNLYSSGSLMKTGAGTLSIGGGSLNFSGTTSITNGTVNLTAIPSSPLSVQLSGSGSLDIATGLDRSQLQGTVTVTPDWVNTTNLGVNINGTIVPLTPGTYPLSAIVVLPAN